MNKIALMDVSKVSAGAPVHFLTRTGNATLNRYQYCVLLMLLANRAKGSDPLTDTARVKGFNSTSNTRQHSGLPNARLCTT